MKNLIIIIFSFISFGALAQNSKPEFDGSKWKPPYSLALPEGWGVERFPIPIEFAPSIPYKGVEDIRFTPGWGNAKSEEYWSYAFLWYLDETPVTRPKIIEDNLTAYYTGLIGRNIEKRKIPADKLFPVKVSVREVTTEPGDLKTYHGTIAMLDYMEQKPIILNCVVHLKSCAGQREGFIFYEISPRPMTDKVWTSFASLWKGFDCKVTEEKK